MNMIENKLYDLSDPEDLKEIEKLKSNPTKYNIVSDKTIVCAWKHMEFTNLTDNTETQSQDWDNHSKEKRKVKGNTMGRVEVWLYDLADSKDLAEIERIKNNPTKYKINVEETINLPYRQIEFEHLNK